MVEDNTYQTKVYHRAAEGDGTTVSGYTIAMSGALVVESGGMIKCTDSATFSCLSDFNFGVREDFTTAQIMKNYLIGRNTWSVLILSGTTLSAGAVADSQPPILPSRIGYFFVSMVKGENNHQMSCRLARGYKGEELVIQFRGTQQSTVLDIHFSDSAIASPIVYGMSDEGTLQEIQLQGSLASMAFLRLVAVSDTEWAVVNAGGEMGNGACYVATPA